MEKRFLNKVAFVTGGSSGIGRATAIAFAEQGAKVVVTDVDGPGGEKTVALIRQQGGHAIFQSCNTSLDSEVQRAVERTVDEYKRLDFAFNNAGVEGDQTPTESCSLENWDRVIDINLKGVWLSMKHQIPVLRKNSTKGTIVNCASIAGVVGFPGLPAYVASKHGIVGLTKTAALELAKEGIRVNCVCPGVIDTPMVSRLTKSDPRNLEEILKEQCIGRAGRPEEVAKAVIWLCSDDSSLVVGHSLVLDGGWIAH